MKAITLHQPWASLIAAGIKTIETRSWSTDHRGALAIHAAKRRFPFDGPEAEMIRDLPLEHYRELGDRIWPGRSVDPELADNYPLGAIVGIADLIDVVPITAPGHVVGRCVVNVGDPPSTASLWGWDMPHPWPSGDTNWIPLRGERRLGDYTYGRWAWLLADIIPLTHPVETRGHRRLWTWPVGRDRNTAEPRERTHDRT